MAPERMLLSVIFGCTEQPTNIEHLRAIGARALWLKMDHCTWKVYGRSN